jgi:hypothetical protein
LVIQLASVLVLAGLVLLGAWLPKPAQHVNEQPAHPIVHVSHAKPIVPVAPGGTSSEPHG